MADNGTLGRILTMTVNGPSERMKGLSDEVAALLKKPKGQITQQEVNDLLGKIDKMRNASPPLNNTEALNRLSFSKSVADRAVNEGLMTPGQYMNRKDALQIGVAGMYGGGSTKMPSGGATGPVLARTGSGVKPVPKPTPAPVKPVASGGGNGVVVQKVKPPPDGFKSYKTHGVKVQNPRETPEGRRLAEEYERMGYSAKDADRKARYLMETGSNLPQANPVDVGDRLYKVVPEGSTPGANSEFWATRDQINNMQGLSRDQIANRFGLPLESQQAPRFDVMEIQATRPGTAFVSDVAPTTQNGWSQTGGASQTLVPDRSGFTPPVRTGQKLP